MNFQGYGLRTLEANYGIGLMPGASLNFSAFSRMASDADVHKEMGAAIRVNLSF